MNLILSRNVKKLFQKKVQTEMNTTFGIFITSHDSKIGCREFSGDWISVSIKEIPRKDQSIALFSQDKGIPLFIDNESLSYLHNFQTITIDISIKNKDNLIIRELE